MSVARLVLIAALLTGLLAAAPTGTALAQGGCRLEQRFVAIHDQVPEIVGECAEAPRTNATNGNVEQRTTKGELVWRSADNRAVFTNGSMTWIIGPNGLQSRANSTTFDWEAIPVAVQSTGPSSSPAPSTTMAAPVLSVAEIAEFATPSIVVILCDQGGGRFSSGTGLKIEDGIVTNAHIVRGAKSIQVLASDGSKRSGKVVLVDNVRDVALISANFEADPLELEDAAEQKVGDDVIVLGYLKSNVIGTESVTVTKGSISAIRDVNGVKHIQTDAAMTGGNSGGPVMNMRGKVIGLATFGIANASGLNFAVSTDEVRAALASEPPPANAENARSAPSESEASAADVSDELKVKCMDIAGKQSKSMAKSGDLNKDETAALFISLTDVCIRVAQLDGKDGVLCHEKAFNSLIADPPKTESAFRTRYNRQYKSCMEA